MRRILAATVAVAMAGPTAARADELSDVKAQLDTAVKSIQALQERVRTLEAQKAKGKGQKAQSVAAVPPNAQAAVFLPVKAAPAAPSTHGAPVVAPNEKPVVTVPGMRDARLELYGAAMLDAIYDIKRVDPTWEATLRPSKIPVNCPPVGTDAGCGTHGETTLSARQSTFGVKGFLPTEAGEIKTQFEFDLFGMGNDAGNTSFRLKQAWGSIGPFLAGYTYTVFMDPDVFPNTIDFWGPSGMIFLFDPQLRLTLFDYNMMKFNVALEAPGFAVDVGKVADVIPELASITERTKYPDITGQFRIDGDWGHLQVAGVARWISFDNPLGIGGFPSGTLFGGGINVSGTLKTFGDDKLHAQVAFGRGIAAYSNDCCFDLGPDANLRAETLPLLDWFVYYDHWWNKQWSSSIGFSQNDQHNSAGQFDTEQHLGSYASVNLLYHPLQNLMVGVEGLWGERVNKDGAKGTDQRVQFSSKFKF
jgi:hypothetical protein